MQSFVQARNKAVAPDAGKPDTDGDLESLKVVLQKKQSRDKPDPAPRVNTDDRNVGTGDKDHAEHAQFDSLPAQAAYSQSVTNTRDAGQNAANVPTMLQGVGNLDQPQSFWSSRWQKDQDSTHDRLESVKRRKIQAIKTGGLATSYIKGDSYADTTSGRLTEYDADDTQSQKTSQGWQPPNTNNRQQLYVRPTVESEALLPPAQIRPKRHKSTDAIDSARIEKKDDVAFASLEQLLPPFTRQPLFLQDHATDRPVSRRSQDKNHRPPQATLFPQKTEPAKSRVAFNTAENNKSKHSSARTEQLRSDYEASITPPNEQRVSVRANPEFAPKLYAMEYGTLQAQSFDEDSGSEQVEEVQAPRVPKDVDRLEELLVLNEEDRIDHIKALSIDAWEDIGNQLVQRFSDAFSKLTQIRRERRTAAVAIEAELDERHKFVTKKRKLTEKSLVEMRSNGSQVLLKTPQRISM